ncbi:cysteine-tRNA ligase, partial [mine drainage metagenome]
MYVCGPTVYDEPHLGHGRFTLVYDILRRYLKYRGIEVRFVSNITDVDDKIIARAAELGISAGELAKRYEEVWWDLMERLGVDKPDETPHATDWIAQMLE